MSSFAEKAIIDSTEVLHTHSSPSLPSTLPLIRNVSSQPIFKEDQHLIKSHSAHDTKVSHHEPDPVSVGDDKGKHINKVAINRNLALSYRLFYFFLSLFSSEKQVTSTEEQLATCESGLEKNESSSSSSTTSSEDNISPILQRSSKTTKVRHDDSGVFSEETDSPSPDCMPAKRNFGPFIRSNEGNTCTSAQDEAISCISSQSASSSDPGVASISSDSLTDIENGSENGTELVVKKSTSDQTKDRLISISTDESETEKDFCSPPSVKERIALFQAVVSSSSSSSSTLIKKNSKSLYDIRNEWNKGHSQNHRGSFNEVNREVYSRSSSISSESGDVVPNVLMTGKAIGPPCRRFTSYDPLLCQASPSSGKDNYISSSLGDENRLRLSHSHNKLTKPVAEEESSNNNSVVVATATTADAIDCNSENCNSNLSDSGSVSLRRSSVTSYNGSISSQGASPRASYSMSDLLAPALVSSTSGLLSSLKTNPPKYSPAFKRRNPDMPGKPSDFSLVQSSSSTLSSSAINLTTSSDRIDPVATTGAISRQSTGSSSIDSCIHLDDGSASAYSDHENAVKITSEDSGKAATSQCKSEESREKGGEETSCLVDSAKHFRELARKWEQRILRDREQNKINRTSLVGKQGSSTVRAKPVEDAKLQLQQQQHQHQHLQQQQQTLTSNFTNGASSNGVLSNNNNNTSTSSSSKGENGISGSISKLWPPDNNNSPARNVTSFLEEEEEEEKKEKERTTAQAVGEEVEVEEASTFTISSCNKSNSCIAAENIKDEGKKSDAFSSVKDSIEHSRMSSIDSTSTSDSGTSSPGYSNASIVPSNCISGGATGVSNATCKDFSTRANAISNLKSDVQYGSVTSLASSTSIISPNELQQLIEDANNSIDGESCNGPHSIQVVVLSRDFSFNGPVGISLAGGADCETKEITVSLFTQLIIINIIIFSSF